jgi:hypothetical protein
MARLVEDSDDEFPDLGVLMCKHGGGGAKPKASTADQTKTLIVNGIQNQNAVKSNARFQNMDFDGSTKDLPVSHKNSENLKPRRRVLHKICDNVLLQPFDPASESKPPSSPSKHPKAMLPVSLNRVKSYGEFGGGLRMTSLAEEEISMTDSSGMSDFIVDDSSFLDDDDNEDTSEDDTQACPPRSTRRLVKGRRRPPGGDSSEKRDPGHGNHIGLHESTALPQLASEPSNSGVAIRNTRKDCNKQTSIASQSRDKMTRSEPDEALALPNL